MRRLLPLPVVHGIHDGLRKNRMATLDIHGLDAAIGRNDGLNSNHSRQSHTARQTGIGGRGPLNDAALSRILRWGLRGRLRQ